MHSVAAFLTFARAHDIDCSDSNAVGCSLYDFISAFVTAVPKWNTFRCKRERSGELLAGTIFLKVASRSVEKYRDRGVKRDSPKGGLESF